MKQYRLAYDKLFTVSPSICFEAKTITDISLLFEYRVFDKTTDEEYFFTCSDDEEMKEQYLDGYSLNAYYKCSYDKDKGYKMEATPIAEKSKYRVEYRLDSCSIGIDVGKNYSHEEEIDTDTCMKLLRDNYFSLDNTNNQSTQSVAYCAVCV